jgi:hypothetical protein
VNNEYFVRLDNMFEIICLCRSAYTLVYTTFGLGQHDLALRANSNGPKYLKRMYDFRP